MVRSTVTTSNRPLEDWGKLRGGVFAGLQQQAALVDATGSAQTRDVHLDRHRFQSVVEVLVPALLWV